MPKRRFVINGFNGRPAKGYSIRNHYFVPQANGGLAFETDDPEVIRLIEGADGYGVFIHPAETQEEIAAMKAAEAGIPEDPLLGQLAEALGEPDKEHFTSPIAHQGARGTSAGRGQRKGDIIEKSK